MMTSAKVPAYSTFFARRWIHVAVFKRCWLDSVCTCTRRFHGAFEFLHIFYMKMDSGSCCSHMKIWTLFLRVPCTWHSLPVVCDSPWWQLEEFQHFLREGEFQGTGVLSASCVTKLEQVTAFGFGTGQFDTESGADSWEG